MVGVIAPSFDTGRTPPAAIRWIESIETCILVTPITRRLNNNKFCVTATLEGDAD